MSVFKEDVLRRKFQYELTGIVGTLTCLASAGFWVVLVYRLGQKVKQAPKLLSIPLKLVYFVIFYLVQTLTGISVQAYSRIGPGFVVRDRGCIFVVAESIGKNFTVSQGVTVGNIRGSRNLPIIGDDVYIEPGAKILGEVTLGNNVVVRANSLVLANVPDNSIACGNPARIKAMPGFE